MIVPITINTVAKNPIGDRKIRLASLSGSRKVRTDSLTVDFGTAAARIISNSMAV